jgi:hypothetical protein
MLGLKRGRQAASLLSKSICIPYPSSYFSTINHKTAIHQRGRIKREMNMCSSSASSSRPRWYTTSLLLILTLFYATAPAFITARLIVASKTAKVTAATKKGPSDAGTFRTATATITTPMNHEPPDRPLLAPPTFLIRSSHRKRAKRNQEGATVSSFFLKKKSGDPAARGFEQKHFGALSHRHHNPQGMCCLLFLP